MLMDPWLNRLEKVYSFFIKIGSNLQSLFILYMRMTWGHQLFLLGTSHLKDIEDYIQVLTKYNFPAPTFHAYEFALVQAVGGILLFIGLLSRLSALAVIGVTLAVLSIMHTEALSSFQFVIDPFALMVQRPFPFLMLGLIVFIFGPGRISFDAWIKRWVDRLPRY